VGINHTNDGVLVGRQPSVAPRNKDEKHQKEIEKLSKKVHREQQPAKTMEEIYKEMAIQTNRKHKIYKISNEKSHLNLKI
ncbi:MAG: hypothetical protein K2G97_03420, partial [Oscillospiraceae bacterium]|nr:hypothetical protein [Oscillospiraceae bacterium]